MEALFFTGQQFQSYNEFQKVLHRYQEEQSVLLIRYHSRKLEKDNGRHDSVTHGFANKDLAYSELLMRCKYGGENNPKILLHNENSSLVKKRKISTLKTNCPFRLCLYITPDGQKLRVKTFIEEHNHLLDTAIYDNYSENRRLPEEVENQVMEMLAVKGSRKAIQAYVLNNHGIHITTKYLLNLGAKTKNKKAKMKNKNQPIPLIQIINPDHSETIISDVPMSNGSLSSSTVLSECKESMTSQISSTTTIAQTKRKLSESQESAKGIEITDNLSEYHSHLESDTFEESVDDVKTIIDYNTTMEPLFFTGQHFQSFHEFQNLLYRYQEENSVVLSIYHSRKIVNDKGRHDAVTYGIANKDLIFTELLMRCKHGGEYVPKYSVDSQVKNRKRSTIKTNCPFRLSLYMTSDGQMLHVKHFIEEHNHIIDSTIYKNYPENRRLPEELEKQVKEMLAVKGKRKEIQAYVLNNHGTHVTIRDLINLQVNTKNKKAKLKRKNQPIPLNQIIKPDHSATIISNVPMSNGIFSSSTVLSECKESRPSQIGSRIIIAQTKKLSESEKFAKAIEFTDNLAEHLSHLETDAFEESVDNVKTIIDYLITHRAFCVPQTYNNVIGKPIALSGET